VNKSLYIGSSSYYSGVIGSYYLGILLVS